MDKIPTKVLVTDGNNRAALAITRSLGRHGYNVIVASKNPRSLAGSSRFCRKHLVYTDPKKDPAQFRADILRFVHQESITILMPTAEITTLQCMRLKKNLQGQCNVPFQNYDAVNRAASKYEVLKLAQNMGIPIPTTYYLQAITGIDQVQQFCKTIGYPVVVKPSRSHLDVPLNNYHSGVQYAESASDLREIISKYTPPSFPILIQERIYGPGVGVFACFNQGNTIAHFSHRRIREKPPSGGVSVLRKSFPVDPQLKQYTDKLLNVLQWHGVAMVEFKKDEKTGTYKLMEINGRFWGSLQLAIDAGVDFPLLLARIAEGKPTKRMQSYNMNIHTRWLWGDIDALIAVLFKRRKNLHLPIHFPNRLKYLKDFLRLDYQNRNLEVLKLDDPGPFIFETLRWFNTLY